MKQMRSRFRLITLLLVCAFLLTLVLCAGSVLKEAGITLSSLPVIGGAVSPVPSAGPDASVSPAASPADGLSEFPTVSPAEIPPEGTGTPGTDISPVPEYNVFGL